MEQHRSPLIVYANFFSDAAVGLAAHEVMAAWAEQAPRKIWLLRPGDVLVTPVPLSEAFRRYASDLLGVPRESVAVVTAPPAPGLPMAEALCRAGLLDTLRRLVAERPGAELLPVALDASTAAFAARLGLPVAPYGPGGLERGAVDVAYRLNTKSGFRTVAADLGMRIPAGRVCGAEGLRATVAAMLGGYERVVVKPDRSAGGQGLRFLSRSDPAPMPPPEDPAGTWVVEQCLDVARSVSIQMEVGQAGPHAVFSGEMRTAGGCYTGYVSPLEDAAQPFVAELERWGAALGRHLARFGYAGPYGIDAVIAADGSLYATESNVRRTATTTARSMVERLGRAAGLGSPAWLLGKRPTRSRHDFDDALRLLRTRDLAWDPGRGEGVVLYGDAPADGRSWRYAVIASGRARAAELEGALAGVMAFEDD
ncbi:peptide ligase PGM1-related protein [Streptomyces sp. NPDC057445]|uniref:preATP grasp domain-containing protein n=1 Tax=Streptomyces sp. NPDC057445 TaxID=3346136 RepID=UPI003692BF54